MKILTAITLLALLMPLPAVVQDDVTDYWTPTDLTANDMELVKAIHECRVAFERTFSNAMEAPKLVAPFDEVAMDLINRVMALNLKSLSLVPELALNLGGRTAELGHGSVELR